MSRTVSLQRKHETKLGERVRVVSFQAAVVPRPRPYRAIRAKCVECAGGSYQVVRECTNRDCALWNYRAGMKPSTAKAKGWEVE